MKGIKEKILILVLLSVGYIGFYHFAIVSAMRGFSRPIIPMYILGIVLYIIGVILLFKQKED